MIELSFLPRDEGRRAARRARRRAAAAVAAAAAVLGAHALWLRDYWTLRSQADALARELEGLRPAWELRRRVEEAERRLQEQRSLLARHGPASGVRTALESLGAVVPATVVLEQVSLERDGEVTITGRAPTLADVARLVWALEATGRFTRLQVVLPEGLAAGAPEARAVALQLLDASPEVRFELRGALGGEP